MSLAHIRPGESRKPLFERLPDSRWRMTRFLDLGIGGQLTDAKTLAWGTQDPGVASGSTVGFAGLLLTNQRVEQAPDNKMVRVLTYEQIPAALELLVGNPAVGYDQYKRKTVVLDYLQFSTGTAVYQVVGTTAAPAPHAACILKLEERTDDGTLRRIKRTYIDPGRMADDEELKFGGKLKLRTLTGLNQVPTTPTGFTLATQSTEFIEGLPVYRYGYAAAGATAGAGGQISQDIDYSQSSDQGTTGVTVQIIRQVTDLSVASNPISTPSGFTLIGVTYADEAGYRIWTARYAKGVGTIITDDETRNNGALLLRTLTKLGSAPATPSGYTLVTASVRAADGYDIYTSQFSKGDGEISRRTTRGQNGTTEDGTLGTSRLDIDYLTAPAASEPSWASVSGYTKLTVSKDERDGHMVWSAIFGKGVGLVAQLISASTDGLREVTNISLGTRSAPAGIVTRDDYRNDDGHIVYTVTSKQTASGGSDPTAATYSVERYVPFLYPGRAKAYLDTYEYFTLLDLFKSPPVQAQVPATVTISYQTSNSLGSISDLWNPTEWCVMRASWTGFGYNPYSQIEALSGYRSVDDTPVDATCSAFAPIDLTIMGNPVYGATTAQIQTTGGPEDPGGNTYTLHAELEDRPAFYSTAGTPYYRKTVITATIPAQAALPV